MYTRNSGSGYDTRQSYQQKKQEQDKTPHTVATFITQPVLETKSNPAQMLFQSQQNNGVNVLNFNTGKASINPVKTNASVEEMPKTLISEKNALDLAETVQNTEGDQTKEEKKVAKMIWPPKTKINKKEQKKKLNAKMRRLICPKSPLMVFSEMCNNVPIKLQENIQTSYTTYIASIEVDGQTYIGEHMSKTQAKQKACERFLRTLLAKKMTEPPAKKEDMDVSASAATIPQGQPKEDFPWPLFASLAMHNLIAHWELQPVGKISQDEETNKLPKKPTGMKKFPENPTAYNPVQLLHQLLPDITFCDKTISPNNPPSFECSCELKGTTFVGKGSTKKMAKKECAIAAIKHNWGFDYHANKV
ncbi:uncharacterized protein LOC126838000 [Adelges cooleyi]|uniref:uncharacterized protein LOC126838000 n=1 Tax=Adelges cooleyi TaxID=133065 RepID=UPI0021801D9E|nr:uncharacterized protein LOC126838000 [Adelges cooleyi]